MEKLEFLWDPDQQKLFDDIKNTISNNAIG